MFRNFSSRHLQKILFKRTKPLLSLLVAFMKHSLINQGIHLGHFSTLVTLFLVAVVLGARTKAPFLFPSTRLIRKVKAKKERKKKDLKKSLLIGGANILLRKKINVNMETKMVIVMPKDTRTRRKAPPKMLEMKENQGSNNTNKCQLYIISILISYHYQGCSGRQCPRRP